MINRFPAVAALLLAVSFLMFGPPAAHAQNAHKTTFTASLTPPTARPGETVKLTVTATIEAPFHIYSVIPTKTAGPQPTEFTIEAKGLSPMGSVTESAPHVALDKNFNTEVGQHEGTATFTQLLKVEPGTTGSVPVKASVRFMACNASSCLPPKTLDLVVPALPIESGAPRPEYVNLQPDAAATMDAPLPAQTARKTSFTTSLTPSTARPGETVSLTVTATVEAPYHIYSVVPPKAAGPQPTELTIEAKGLSPVGSVTESAPHISYDKQFKANVGQHEGTATFTQLLKVEPTATGSVPVQASVRFMACNASSCLPPYTLALTVPALTIEAGVPRPEYVNQQPGTAATSEGTSTGAMPAASGSFANGSSSGSPANGSLLGFVLTAFGAGLLALITPCVFPLIPVTFAFFTKQVTEKGGSVVKLATVYCLGIIVTFTAIGAILAATVGAAGANRFASNPWVNLVFAALFVVFGLSLLELIELRPPAFLQSAAGKGRQNSGTLGVFVLGLTFVVSAFTCTAPFIGTVLVAASTASTGAAWIRPIAGMASFATALALPFFLLALFPSLLARLPKSGAWLSTVKGAMGFLELAAALKFLSNADLVWQWKALTLGVVLALWAIIALAGSAWLLGILRLGFSTPEGSPSVARRGWAAVFGFAGLYCIYALSGRPIAPLMAALLPPANYGGGASTQSEEDGLAWLPSVEEGLAQAKAQSKPVFIDFTGYTCTNCRWVEENVFMRPEVRQQLSRYVLVRLYTDDKDQDLATARQNYQEKTFGTVALPLYAVVNADGKPQRKGDVDFFGGANDPNRFTSNFLPFLQQREASQTVARK